ncbi:MAG: HlyD family efflux transporter periplasmic adaptor subunit [Acidobacteria bacterium]|nr:HlyD family efflux transporter periplasmic adaptor subunit [Acidobacteriota bacterium]
MQKRYLNALAVLVLTGITALLSSCTTTGFGFKRDDALLFSGTIETREIRVGSKVGGRVQEVLVQEGQQVDAGQALVRFDMAELQAQKLQAQARIEQQSARLEKLQRGARPEEKAQAQAVSETARAQLEAIRTWPRPEEVEQARASVAAAEADANNAETAFQRISRLYQSGDLAQQEYDSAKFRADNARARRDSEKRRLELLLNGSRKEDIRAAEEKYRQAKEAEQLVLAGPRAEEITDARAQLAEAQARLEQLNVQMAEGEVKASANATVEVLTVRPGDLLAANQPVARLLERDQIYVRVFVPEPKLGLIKVGQKAKIKVDSFTDRTFDGVIEQINTQGEFTPRNIQSRDERNHQVFGVKVRIDNREGKLKAGMAADVTLEK